MQVPEKITLKNSKELIEKNWGVSNIENDGWRGEGYFIWRLYKVFLETINEDGYTILLNDYIQSVF